jgi:hypothetical protein
MERRARPSGSIVLVVAFAIGGPASGHAIAQPPASRAPSRGSPRGEIVGRAASVAGRGLSGVAVTVRGSQASGPRFATTMGDGTYRVGDLPPGVYTVKFAIAGVTATEQREVRVDEGSVVRVDVRLGPQHGEGAEPPSPGDSTADGIAPSAAAPSTAEWVTPTPPFVALVGGSAAGLVARSGSRRFAGTARAEYSGWRLQSDNLTPSLKLEGAGLGNPLREAGEAAVDIGGPIRRDSAWIWAAAARSVTDIGIIGYYTAACRAPDGSPAPGAEYRTACMNGDVTTLTTVDLRLQSRWTSGHRSSLLWEIADQRRPARGASAFDRPEHTNRQSSLSLAHPVQVQHQFVAAGGFVLDGTLTFSNSRIVLDFNDPDLAGVQGSYDRYTLVNSRSGVRTDYDRLLVEADAWGHAFRAGWLGGDHTLAFGVRYGSERHRQSDRTGGGAVAVFDSRSGSPLPYQAQVVRDGLVNLGATHWAAVLEESYRRGDVTVDAGIRFARQDDEAFEAIVPASPVLPDLLPAVHFVGADSGVVYNDLSPRLGLAWNIGRAPKVTVKAAVARRAGSGNSSSARLQPTGQTRLVYWWNDANRDGSVQPAELDLARGPAATPSPNYDAANPASVRSPATVDPHLRNVVTDELTVGFACELARHLTLRVSYSGGKTHQLQEAFPMNADGTLVDSQSFEAVRWTPSNCVPGADCPAVTYYQRATALPAATVLRNDGEYTWRHGLDVVLHKRLADGWMLDIAAGWTTAAHFTPRPTTDFTDPTNVDARNGTEYSAAASHWVVNVAASSRLPWGFTTAGAFSARQGLPYARGVTSPNRGALGSTAVDIARYGLERYPSVSRIDWRIDRPVTVGRGTVVPALSVWNALNANTVLARNRIQNSPSADDVTRILAPRTVHLGVSVTF